MLRVELEFFLIMGICNLHHFVPTPRESALYCDGVACGRLRSSRFRGGSINYNLKKNLMSKALFYHAGCPVCVEAEGKVAGALDGARYEVEVVHLGEARHRIAEAEAAGVKSVPALVLDGVPFHINFGAELSALK